MFRPCLPFGVELEFASDLVQMNPLKDALDRALEANHQVRSSNSEAPTVWTIKSDGSCGWEITTPILQGVEGVQLLDRVVQGIQERFGHNDIVSNRCGLHVHFDAYDLSMQDLKKILSAFWHLEPFTYSILPAVRRNCTYCSPLRRAFSQDPIARTVNVPTDHGTAVNACRWQTRGDIEIRYHSGTCDHRKVFNWVCYLQGVIRKALSTEGPPTREIATFDAFRQWIGTPADEWDENVINWLGQRFNHLSNNDPQRTRRCYRLARGVRDLLCRDDRQFFYQLRREMTREAKRDQDVQVLTWARAHGFDFDPGFHSFTARPTEPFAERHFAPAEFVAPLTRSERRRLEQEQMERDRVARGEAPTPAPVAPVQETSDEHFDDGENDYLNGDNDDSD